MVGHLRRQLDVAASWGVPAHVSVLFPFLDPGQVTDDVLDTLTRAVATVPAFGCRFTRTAWFGEEVLWLDPEPAEPFRALTEVVHGAFPTHPPYAGAFTEVVPHVTVGERRHGSPAALRDAELAVSGALPIEAQIDHALLIAGSRAATSWRAVARLPLG